MTNDPQTLVNPALYQGPEQLQVGNGTGLTIHSTGSSSLISRSQPLRLNILPVPEIRKKLLSVYRLTNDNLVFVEFHATYCIVKDEETGRPLLRGTVKDGLYLLAEAHPLEAKIIEKTSSDMWHHRLGHPNMRILQKIIFTYEFPTLSVNKYFSCDACLTSKSHHLPYSKSIHRTHKALEIVHSDLWGPSPVISHAGNRYYVIFVDDFTRYTWLYPLKLKSNVLSVFLDFQLRVERQFGQKIISFQSGWGGEFQALNKHLTRQGITHRISCPHTPAQNGTAEKKHRHIIEIALSLMRHSSVPRQFWDEAVCTAVYLINRLPTPILRNRSPYHLVYNEEPTYSFLRSFGSACYPCLHSYAASKLDPRSDKCVFLGYSASHLGYRCISLSSGKLYISRDVIFQEHDYPLKSSSLIKNSQHSLSHGLLESSPASSDSTAQPSGSSISPVLLASPILPDSPASPASSILPDSSASPASPLSPVLPVIPPDSFNYNPLNSPENSIPSHTPSTNPLSPSNLDHNTSPSHVKTRRLFDILHTLDSSSASHPPSISSSLVSSHFCLSPS